MVEKTYLMKFPNQCRKPYWYGITTNGSVRKDGCAVMGRGVALQAKDAYPWLARMLGQRIKSDGNQMYFWHEQKIFTFPVKHHWADTADLDLIARSALKLHRTALAKPDITFILGRPGCGNGGRSWEEVRPLLVSLPNNVWIVTPE